MRLAALFLVLGACATTPVITKGFPNGRWVVIGYELPRDSRLAGPASLYQVFQGREYGLGKDWIEFPTNGTPPCAGVYRMRERNAEHEDLFDPLRPGGFDLKALGLKGKRLYEVRTGGCMEEFYLSWDRTRIYLPLRGGLLLLEPVGRTKLEKEPLPEPTPTAVIQKMGFEKRPEGPDRR